MLMTIQEMDLQAKLLIYRLIALEFEAHLAQFLLQCNGKDRMILRCQI